MRLRRRQALGLAVGLFAASLAIASCGGDDGEATQTTATTTTQTTTTQTTTTVEPPSRPTVVRVRVVNGVPRGGIVRETVKKGDRVVIAVTSDVGDHVHLHGYDIMRDVRPGRTARIRFPATVPGRFEVELEDRGVQIADLTVEP